MLGRLSGPPSFDPPKKEPLNIRREFFLGVHPEVDLVDPGGSRQQEEYLSMGIGQSAS